MAIKSSGSSLAFSEIEAEFGANGSRSLGAYRLSQSVGELTLPLDTGIPTSGQIKFSDFYSKKLNVVVGLQRHYESKYLDLKNKVDNGLIGKIRSGQVYWNGDGVWTNNRKPGQSELEYQMRNWYYFTWLCGDHILEQHIHNIDVANWFIGDYPVSAQGMGGREVRISAWIHRLSKD